MRGRECLLRVEFLAQLLGGDGAVAFVDPGADQVDRDVLCLEVACYPAVLPHPVVRRLGPRQIDGHVARVRQLDAERDVAVTGTDEEEGMAVRSDLDRRLAPRVGLVRFRT